MVMMALEGLERVLQVEETRELMRREQIENGEIQDSPKTRLPSLVNSSLIDKARESDNSSAVTKRAERIWKQHFVECALCKKSFSKHRSFDAAWCPECKCYVCASCNCTVYHLDYQEELWADETKKSQPKKSSKKNKNKKKKEKAKQKKAKQEMNSDNIAYGVKEKAKYTSAGGRMGSGEQHKTALALNEASAKDANRTNDNQTKSNNVQAIVEDIDDKENMEDQGQEQNQQPTIDFVLYLQQTGSIISLAKLMDALEYGEDLDEGLDDTELQLIREQQMLRKATSQ
jgi:hypothetical protein